MTNHKFICASSHDDRTSILVHNSKINVARQNQPYQSNHNRNRIQRTVNIIQKSHGIHDAVKMST